MCESRWEQEIFSPAYRPDGLWDAPSFPFSGYRRIAWGVNLPLYVYLSWPIDVHVFICIFFKILFVLLCIYVCMRYLFIYLFISFLYTYLSTRLLIYFCIFFFSHLSIRYVAVLEQPLVFSDGPFVFKVRASVGTS